MMLELQPRERIILDYLAKGEITGIQQLSEVLQVSSNTVRNDFESMEEKGVIITVRGGAIPAYYPEIIQRMNTNFQDKLLIAKYAASLIEDNDTIMISCGTTCSLIGRYLYGKRNVHLITHSTLLLPFARTNPNLRFILVGGEFIPAEDAVVGMSAIEELDAYYSRLTLVGSDNFSFESGITTSSDKVASVLRKMLTQAQQRVLVVESRKFGKALSVKICSLEEIDIIVTDDGLEDHVAKVIHDMGKKLIIATND